MFIRHINDWILEEEASRDKQDRDDEGSNPPVGGLTSDDETTIQAKNNQKTAH
jgi:hypothetical protein